jgi:hypothetical protein
MVVGPATIAARTSVIRGILAVFRHSVVAT